MAIRIFCHGTDEDPGHRQRCGEYLRLRHRVLAQRLLDGGDITGIRTCMAAGMFPAEEKERMLCMAVQRGRTDCLGALLSSEKEMASLFSREVENVQTECPGVLPAANLSYDRAGGEPRISQPLHSRVLTLLGRNFDRFYPYLGQIFHLLVPARLEGHAARLGTDGFSLCMQESSFLQAFSEDHERCQRDVAHVLLHQLLFHPFYAGQIRDRESWNICCDCLAEWTLERRLGYERTVSVEERRQRTEVYRFLEKEKLVSVAAFYRRLQEMPQEQQQGLGQLFVCDDHQLWYRGEHSTEQWKNQIRRQKRMAGEGSEEAVFGGIQGSGGHTVRTYQEPEASEYEYQAFLERFMVAGEERILDQENFDPILYHYSRCHYDGPVLLEPLETSEVRRLSELVIAIDTSGSCSGDIVQQFLRETFTILEKKERFFRKMRVHILQCDSMIQDYQLIESEDDWEKYRKNVKITGFGNTDFRPVFDWIREKQKSGEIRDLKGLIYFSDGDGIFPREAPDYETAFVYLNERLLKGKLPAFIRQVNLHIDREFSNLFDEESSFGYCGGK